MSICSTFCQSNVSFFLRIHLFLLPRWNMRPEWRWARSRSAGSQSSGGGTTIVQLCAGHCHRAGRWPQWYRAAGGQVSSPWWCWALSRSAPESQAKWADMQIYSIFYTCKHFWGGYHTASRSHQWHATHHTRVHWCNSKNIALCLYPRHNWLRLKISLAVCCEQWEENAALS